MVSTPEQAVLPKQPPRTRILRAAATPSHPANAFPLALAPRWRFFCLLSADGLQRSTPTGSATPGRGRHCAFRAAAAASIAHQTPRPSQLKLNTSP